MVRRPITIAINLLKGGSAKSTTAWALASYLATRFRTLVVDMDSQASLTHTIAGEVPEFSTYHVFRKQVAVTAAVVPAAAAYPANLFLLAGSSALANLEAETSGDLDRAYVLSDALASSSAFDFVIIDTPPSPGIQTVASLVAATAVVSPVTCDPASYEQLPTFEVLLAQVRRRANPSLIWAGILPTRFDSRNTLDNEVLQEMRNRYGPGFVMDPVRATVRLREAQAQGLPPWQQTCGDYLTATNDLLRRLSIHDTKISADTASRNRRDNSIAKPQSR